MLNINSTKSKKFYYNKLYYDYIFNFETLKTFYAYDYRLEKSYAERINHIKAFYNDKFRSVISDALLRYNESVGCSSKTIENARMLKDKNTFVVIAGQQPSILSGAVFTIYKILTVLNIAEYLKDHFNVNVVPLFWNASDDNDLPEIKSIKIPGSQMDKISLDVPECFNGFSYSKIFLPLEEYENISRKLIDSLFESGFKKGIVEFLTSVTDYAKAHTKRFGISISDYYSLILEKLFKEHGLVIIDPQIPEIKKLSREIIDFDISKFKEINAVINFNGEELRSEGYNKQLKSMPDNLDFFLNTQNGREKIKSFDKDNFIFEKSFKTRKNPFKKGELTDLIYKNISDVSLNVVLRPLFQDHILPNIATVCGPGEISYYAQLKDIYTLFGSELPILYPRFSVTIIENKTKKAMDKINVIYDDMEYDEDVLLDSILKNMLGFDYQTYLSNLENKLSDVLCEYEEKIKKQGLTINDAFNRINQNLKKEVMVLGKRIINQHKRKNNIIVESLSKIYNNIFPEDKLQEREINIFEYVNKYGFGFIDEISSCFEIFNFLHRFIEIN
ncbi:MAG: bacillithiol biosynthesis cysteine-adding enzyme BshC [Actinomycetota bacterium]|nr:bacillithiol biosynthesis cysteine-adding enzyme BshC [Actinomycetota bacterium]